MRVWDPQNEFPGIPGSAFFLELLHSLIGNPEFPGIFWRFPIAFSREDEVDMLGSGGEQLLFASIGVDETVLDTLNRTSPDMCMIPTYISNNVIDFRQLRKDIGRL